MEFANMYRSESFVEQILVYRKKENDVYLILFQNAPNLERFAFAVNFINYIQNVPSKPSVYGYYFNRSKQIENKFQTNDFVKLYVSKSDNEYDNVNIVNQENETYLYGFDGTRKKIGIVEETFETPTIEFEDFHHILDVIPGDIKAEDKPWWKFW